MAYYQSNIALHAEPNNTNNAGYSWIQKLLNLSVIVCVVFVLPACRDKLHDRQQMLQSLVMMSVPVVVHCENITTGNRTKIM